jgi:uncharacterized membrane protein YeaQ/YmgE (transglycosylase-associated protein family)
MVMGFWGYLLAGLVVALIVQIVKRGQTKLPWWGLYLVGIVGAMGGYALASQLGVESTSGIDWIRWALSVGVAMVAIWVIGALGGRKR